MADRGAELHRDQGDAGGDDAVGRALRAASGGAHLSGADGRGADRDQRGGAADAAGRAALCRARSEEHTSELQSLMRISYAVFCLKKKKQHKYATMTLRAI